MLTQFRIQNYRLFGDLEIAPLGRINLVAGRNNAGKTSLLEALFLLAGAETARLDAAQRPSPLLSYTKNSVPAEPPTFSIADGKMELGAPDTIPFPAVFLAATNRSPSEDANRFAALRREKKGGLILEAMRILEPRLRSLEENSSSGHPMIWGDIGLPELVPLAAMGEGMTRLARMLLSMSSAQDGIFMVDEVENGIHHSCMESIWKAIETASTTFNTQVFATTHSYECISAAHTAIGDIGGLVFHRLERGAADGDTHCITFQPENLAGGLKHAYEIR